MSRFISRAAAIIILAAAMYLGGSPALAQAPVAAGTPALRSVDFGLTIIRFKPADREMILEDLKLPKGASNTVEFLRSKARVVDVIYRGSRSVMLAGSNTIRFDAMENRPVVLVGKVGQPLPPATAYGLTLQVTVQPAAGDLFALTLDGQLVWSPDLIDRRIQFNEVMSFLGKTANAAQNISGQLKPGESDTLRQATGIGLAVAELFKPDKTGDTSIYELPVTKTVALNSSRFCRSGDMVVISTASEASVNTPQVLLLVLEATVTVHSQ